MHTVPERDWKLLSASKSVYLNRLCARINAETLALLHRTEGDDHQRYLAVYQHTREADELVADIFNLWRRSHFHRILATLIREHLTGAEITGMSAETREAMRLLYRIEADSWDGPF